MAAGVLRDYLTVGSFWQLLAQAIEELEFNERLRKG
jgi:hypothetical protein